MHRILFVFTVCAFLTGGCSDESSPDFFIIDTDGDGLADFSERSIGTSPTIADTDGDGLRDGSERANGTSPLLADTDSDGLCDGWSSTVGCVGGERFAGTDPTNPDTDGDGLLDGREDLNGDGIISLVRINGLRETNPFDVDTDDDGVNDGVEDINHNGKLNLDLGETDPGDPDTDGNGECDFPRVDNDGDGLNPADGCFWKVMYVKRKRDLPEGQENAPRDGTSWRNAFARIQHAIDAASEGTGIWVSQGSHFSIGSEPVAIMRQGISLFGGFSGTETKVEERSADAELTILDGSGLSNPVVLGATNTIIDGFVIANGRSGDPDNDEFANGAGYSIENADYVRLENVVFRNNQSVYGGGVYSRGSRLVLRNSIFENNSADLGGALYSNTNESLEIFNTVFSNNNAKTGGAIYNLAADLQIDASRFTDNNALTTGGCIFMAESQVGIERSAFKGNMAKTGGCITNDQAELIVFDSVFESNLAVISGGAVFNSTVINSDINNNVFIDNKATIGGAIYNAGSFLEITENVFAKNVAQNLAINDANDGVDSVGSGGAVYNVAESSVYYENNAFIANIAETGGAFYSLFSKPVVVDSLFAYNQAASSGGAIYEDSAGGFFYNLSVLGNSADSGGGAFIELSQTQIINSLVSENTGIEPGAGIYSAGSYTQLVSSSFIDNTTLTGSAAVYHSNELDSSSVIQIYNSLFWGNTGPYQDFFTTENSLIKIESNCTEQDFDAGGFEKDRHIGNDEGPIKNQSIITEEPVIAADAGQHIYLLDNDLACVDSGDAVFSQFRILDDWRELSTFPDGTTERQSDANKNSIMLDAGRHYLPGSVALSAFSIDSSNANWNIKLNRSSANYECLFFNDASNEYTVIGSDDSRWQDEIDILADQKSREGSFVHGLAIGDTLWMVCMDLNEIVDGDFVAGRGEPVIVQATIP